MSASLRNVARGLTIVVVAAVLLATGCTTRSPDPSPTATANAPPTGTPAPSPSPSANASAAATVTAQVYFANDRLGDVCTESFAVARRVRPPGVAAAALRQLLRGPTASERAAGYSSWFSQATAGLLGSVRIQDGEARVDFDAELQRTIPGASSSCGSSALLGALDATLRQFPAVRGTRYSLDGHVDAFYEWLQLAPPEQARS